MSVGKAEEITGGYNIRGVKKAVGVYGKLDFVGIGVDPYSSREQNEFGRLSSRVDHTHVGFVKIVFFHDGFDTRHYSAVFTFVGKYTSGGVFVKYRLRRKLEAVGVITGYSAEGVIENSVGYIRKVIFNVADTIGLEGSVMKEIIKAEICRSRCYFVCKMKAEKLSFALHKA